MHFNELNSFKISDAVRFHEHLNPAIFDGDHMKQDVREQLLLIANDFIEHLGLPDLAIQDITISGSNAAYSYTNLSDIDLHLLVDMNQFNEDDVYRELFDAKKTVYNDNHDILIDGYEVELYVQDSNQPVISLGEYSVMNDKWLKLPRKRKADFDQVATKLKYHKLYKLAEYALKSDDPEKINRLIKTVKKYRRIGLDFNGEFGPENIAFKALRNKGIIKKLYEKLQLLHSQRLSLPEGVSPELFNDPNSFEHSMEMNGYYFFAKGTSDAKTHNSPKGFDKSDDLIGLSIYVIYPYYSNTQHVAESHFIVHRDDNNTWVESDWTHVNTNHRRKNLAYMMYAYAKMLGNDIKPSTGTNEKPIQTTSGSNMWEKWGKDAEHLVREASGYIPSPKEKNDRRWMTALTADITPFTMQQNAKKLGSKISRAGIPPLLRP